MAPCLAKAMSTIQLKGSDLLVWRRRLLVQGGHAADLDWLLDLAGGLRWAALQQLQLNPDLALKG